MLVLVVAVFMAACGGEPVELVKEKTDFSAKIKLEVKNLPKLTDSHYEGWVLADGRFVSVAKFSVGEDGTILNLQGQPVNEGIFDFKYLAVDISSRFMVTIEPNSKTDDSKSPTVVLEGNFSPVKVSDLYFSAYDTESMGGSYQLRSFSDSNDNMNEYSGLWFMKIVEGKNRPSLDINDLGPGWMYEAWVEKDGRIISLGKFSGPKTPDMSNIYALNTSDLPKYPGEDFLKSATGDSLKMPLSLVVGKNSVFITLEPYANGLDLSGDSPFSFRLMEAQIPARARVHFNYDMINVAMNSMPSGKVLYLPSDQTSVVEENEVTPLPEVVDGKPVSE